MSATVQRKNCTAMGAPYPEQTWLVFSPPSFTVRFAQGTECLHCSSGAWLPQSDLMCVGQCMGRSIPRCYCCRAGKLQEQLQFASLLKNQHLLEMVDLRG